MMVSSFHASLAWYMNNTMPPQWCREGAINHVNFAKSKSVHLQPSMCWSKVLQADWFYFEIAHSLWCKYSTRQLLANLRCLQTHHLAVFVLRCGWVHGSLRQNIENPHNSAWFWRCINQWIYSIFLMGCLARIVLLFRLHSSRHDFMHVQGCQLDQSMQKRAAYTVTRHTKAGALGHDHND